MLVTGDDEVRAGRNAAFQNFDVCWIVLHRIDSLNGFKLLCEIANAFSRKPYRIFGPPELLRQHASDLVENVVGDAKPDLTGPRHVEQFVRRSAEVQRRKVDIGIGGDRDHLPSALLTGFSDQPRHIVFRQTEFARFGASVALERTHCFSLM
jgi:hypothetical protein